METVRVTNVDPTVAIAGVPTVPPLETSPVSLSADFSDPGTLDTFTYAWSVTRGGLPYDDGTGNRTDQPDFTFVPDDDGTYRVTLRITRRRHRQRHCHSRRCCRERPARRRGRPLPVRWDWYLRGGSVRHPRQRPRPGSGLPPPCYRFQRPGLHGLRKRLRHPDRKRRRLVHL